MNTKSIAALGLLLAMSCASAQAAKIEYPMLDNLRLEEGTLELWLTPMTELDPPIGDKPYLGVLKLFHINIPNEFRIGCVWALRSHDKAKGGRIVGIGASAGSTRMARAMKPLPLGAGKPNWKQGQLHHLAFVWRGKSMQLYADGKACGGRDQLVPMHGKRGNHVLVIGHDWSKPEPFILHAVRVSSIARDEQALTEAKPTADLSTLLLDVFDKPEAHENPPVISSHLVDVPARRIAAPVHWVQSPRPGLALYPPVESEKKQ